MAPPAPKCKVSLAAEAQADLRAIWNWNAERYGEKHADAYLRFLYGAMDSLVSPSTVGRAIPEYPNFRYLLMRRRSSGHGHLAVFRIAAGQVMVSRVLHTAQDWPTHLPEESPE
jgi:plasmid stabilization system protein ParE